MPTPNKNPERNEPAPGACENYSETLVMYSDRPLRADDVSAVIALHHLPHAEAFMHAPSEDRLRRLVDDDTMRARVIVEETGSLAGFFALSLFDGWLAEIHGIVAARQRNGIGRWAVREALRWSFEDAGAHRVWLEVVAADAPARALYHAEGLTHEGTYREGYAAKPGAFEDLAHYGILAREWQAQTSGSGRTRVGVRSSPVQQRDVGPDRV